MGEQSSDEIGRESAATDRDLSRLLAPRGRLTTDDAVALRDAALHLAMAGQPVTIECVDLEDLGGAALQVLLALAVDLRRRAVRVHLANPGPAVRRTLSLSGATAFFDVA